MSAAKGQTVPMRVIPQLWIFWFGLLFGGMIMAGFQQFDKGPFLKATHLASSLALVLAGFCFVSGADDRRVKWPLFLIAVGMFWGFLGDLSNAGVLFGSDELSLMGGIITFAIGHVFYMSACLILKNRFSLHNAAAWWGSILVWQIISIVGWAVVVLPNTPHTFNHWAALPYSMLLGGTAGMTCGLALQDKRFFLLGLGGALFLASDLVLALQMFRHDLNIGEILAKTFHWQDETGNHFFRQVSRNACWLLYGPAQMLIVYSSYQIIAAYRSLGSESSSMMPASRSAEERIPRAEEPVA